MVVIITPLVATVEVYNCLTVTMVEIALFMVALWNRADHYIFILSFVLSFYLFFLA